MDEPRVLVPLSGLPTVFATIDPDDWTEVSRYQWRRIQYRYRGALMMAAEARLQQRGPGPRERIALHRLITNPMPSEHVDHLNGDTLDNRRANLRTCRAGEALQTAHGPWSSRRPGLCWCGADDRGRCPRCQAGSGLVWLPDRRSWSCPACHWTERTVSHA